MAGRKVENLDDFIWLARNRIRAVAKKEQDAQRIIFSKRSAEKMNALRS